MIGLLARPARETRNRRAEGAKARAAERKDAGGSGAAADLGAATLDTVPLIAVGGW
uniref:IDP2350 n=1 Tax=Arundo donax TaxID=35708 RepID=A0A0A9EQD7_ARUDO